MKYILYLFATVLIALEIQAQNLSVAREWNEVLLEAIRNDYARPTIHARNLFHISAAMYDAWAVHDDVAIPFLLGRSVRNYDSDFNESEYEPLELTSAKNEAISYAAYRLIIHRFSFSPGRQLIYSKANALMDSLKFDIDIEQTDYESGNPAALGNYIAKTYIEFGLVDGSNEESDYISQHYQPKNPPIVPQEYGNPLILDYNRWQPMFFDEFIDQSGNIIPTGVVNFLSPEWGKVTPFALSGSELNIYNRNNNEYWVYHDPGPPPYMENDGKGSTEDYQWSFSLVSIWGSHLDPSDSVKVDISPANLGNIPLQELPESFENYSSFYNTLNGGDIGQGHEINPITGESYSPNVVLRGDYTRVLAEFWADGPDSETPPGHWFTILNYVRDHPLSNEQFEGKGEDLPGLEFDIKSYFILGGAMHDAAISAWGIKGWYDYIRPISALRAMSDLGQSSDPSKPNYDPRGIPLVEGYVELVEEEDALAGSQGEYIGKIKLKTWKGHDFISDPETDVAGVGWILSGNWWPYQRPTFVTPPFAGYVSGHSTFSRAAAEVLTLITGDSFFPGGMGEFVAKKKEFLVFEEGPSEDVTLQWATYQDASDQTSLSRIWGGIHPPADDIPGRIIGEKIGKKSFEFAKYFFNGTLPLRSPSNNSTLTVYPNPVKENNVLNVMNEDNQFTSFLLLDLNGKVLKRCSLDQNSQVNLIGISSGMYLYIISGAHKSRKGRLLITK